MIHSDDFSKVGTAIKSKILLILLIYNTNSIKSEQREREKADALLKVKPILLFL